MSMLLEETSSKRKTREAALADTPLELQSEMLEVLRQPNLIRWISDRIEASGVAGEHLLALTICLTGISRLLTKPLAVIVQGPSSSGKSFVIESVTKLFPDEAVLLVTDITPQAFYYMSPGELKHRFVVAGERSRQQDDGTAQATKALREMISSGRLTKLVTMTDADGPHTVQIEQEGPIAFAESTTAPEIFEEDANRCLILEPDERPEQTRRIVEAQLSRLAGYHPSGDRQQIRSQMHCLHRLLEPADVVFPYAEELGRLLPVEPLEVRRSVAHVSSMIQTSALLHQYQRERDAWGRVIAQAEDYWIAHLILNGVMMRSLGRKPPDALTRFVQGLRMVTGEFTAKEIAKRMKMSERTVRDYLQPLLELGVVEQTSIARGPIPARWLIRADLEIRWQGESVLPSVTEVCGVREEELALPEVPSKWFSANLSDVPF